MSPREFERYSDPYTELLQEFLRIALLGPINLIGFAPSTRVNRSEYTSLSSEGGPAAVIEAIREFNV